MKALIVEDEKLAQRTLTLALERNFPDIEVAGVTDSVQSTLDWLRTPDNTADIIFMDVELLDGSCFEIFKQETVTAKVVMTTAYDKYAVKAFEAGSVDYLLKPYDDEALQRAVGRCRASSENFDIASILAAMEKFTAESAPGKKNWRRRFIIRLGNKIIPVDTADIAYLYVEGKSKYIVRNDGTRYFVDQPLESILDELDPAQFFRISRNYVIASHSIQGIERMAGGRLKLLIYPAPPDTEMIVSRSRVNDFMAWLV